MTLSLSWRAATLIATFCAACASSLAQTYPARPLRIVTSEAGGGTDFASRIVAQELTSRLGQAVIVDNRPTNLSGEIASKAQPDGYTLLLAAGAFWIAPLLQKMSYDPIKDFSPVTSVTLSPIVLVVHPTLPVGSVKELIALAKAKGGSLNAAAGAPGSNNHLLVEMFKYMAGVQITSVPYKAAGPGITALLSGEAQLMFVTATSVSAQIKSGRLKALAIASPRPSPLLPGLPTVSAAGGLPDYEAVGLNGVFVPAKTPSEIVKRLNGEIVRVLNQAEVKQKFFDSGVESVPSTPEEFARSIQTERARMIKVIEYAGIRTE